MDDYGTCNSVENSQHMDMLFINADDYIFKRTAAPSYHQNTPYVHRNEQIKYVYLVMNQNVKMEDPLNCTMSK